MTHRFNGELFKYSKDAKLLERIDESWEVNRPSGAPFLHELPPNVLEPLVQVCAELVARTVPRSEYNEYTKLSMDTTKRLGLALDVIRDLAYSNKPISRSALRGWFLSLSVPSDTDKNDVQAPAQPGSEDDYLKGATIFFEDFRQALVGVEIDQLPPHVAAARLGAGVGALGAALNSMLQYLIEGDNDCRKALKEFKQDVGHMVKVELDQTKTRGFGNLDLADCDAKPDGPSREAIELEQRESNLDLFNDEVLPKLVDLAQAHDSVGELNSSELKALSACLDVAVKARDRKRK